MIIEKALVEASKILKQNEIKSFKLDSEILMSQVLNKSRKFLILHSNNEIKKKVFDRYMNLIKLRSSHKPIAQLIKKKEFWNLDFFVNKNVLIPRPDSEIIVEEVLNLTKNKRKLNILDIGVGSGCILLSILKEKKCFYGTGIDISKKCLEVSKINTIKHGLTKRVRFFKSDIDNFNNGKYDLIISNPPYINKLDLKYLEKDVVNYEPKLALDGGLEGLSEIRKVINKSSELIKKNGIFILEIAFDHKFKVKKILKKKGFYINKFVKDLAKNDRCIISTKI